MTHDRYQAIDYSVPTYLVEYGHFSVKPKRLDPFDNVVAPFQNTVWMVTAATVVIVGLLLLLIHKYCNIYIIQ